jgi:hypothetical protein
MGKHPGFTRTLCAGKHYGVIKFLVYHTVFGVVRNLFVIFGIMGFMFIMSVGIVAAMSSVGVMTTVAAMSSVGVMTAVGIMSSVGIMRPMSIMSSMGVMPVGVMAAVRIMIAVISMMIIAITVIYFPFRNRRQTGFGIYPIKELFHTA